MDGHGNEVAAAPRDEWALPSEADELAELAALGIRVEANGHLVTLEDHGAPADDIARVSAMAAFYLRRLASAASEEAAIAARRQVEEARLERVYGPQLLAASDRQDYCRSRIARLAEVVDALGGFQKKKSIATSGGTFGIKACPAKAKIVDPAAVTTWAQETVPEAVRVTVQLPLPLYRELEATYTGIDEKKREVLVSSLQDEGIDLLRSQIPGIEVSEARTEYVIKPLPEGA